MSINTSPNRLRELALSIKAQHQQMGVDVDGMLAIASEKEAQNHKEQHLNMVAPADVPLPAPPAFYRYQFQSIYGPVWRSSSDEWNGERPIATEGVYTYDQMNQYAEAYAAAKVAAEREQIVEALRQDAINRGGGVRRAQAWAYVADVILKRQKGTV